eukprot:3878493-Pyramimonas_sp.AAC.1
MPEDLGQVDISIATHEEKRARISRPKLLQGVQDEQPCVYIATRNRIASTKNEEWRDSGRAVIQNSKPLSPRARQFRNRPQCTRELRAYENTNGPPLRRTYPQPHIRKARRETRARRKAGTWQHADIHPARYKCVPHGLQPPVQQRIRA